MKMCPMLNGNLFFAYKLLLALLDLLTDNAWSCAKTKTQCSHMHWLHYAIVQVSQLTFLS